MARERDDEGIYVDRPRNDIYLVLLIITLVATIFATLIMWIENSSL